MRLYPASRMAIEYALFKFHYAKAMVNPQLAFSVLDDDDNFCGVICYGVGGAPHLGKDFDLIPGRWIELQRVALNGGHGSTSKAIALSLMLLHKYRPCIKLVISYADIMQGHKGTVYQASNWSYLGIHAKGVKKYFDPVKNKYVHQRGIRKGKLYDISKTKGKHKYVYCLDKSLQPMITKMSKPYPTGEVNAELA